MKRRTHTRKTLSGSLLGIAIALMPAAATSEKLSFRLAFAVVPGIEHIESERYELAIDILERRRSAPDVALLEDELSTLCATYILDRRLEAARKTCDAAVVNDASDAAYNNRGVLRVHLRDVDGALEDFERVRVPQQMMDSYLDAFKRTNPRLMASSNFEIVSKYRARQSATDKPAPMAVSGAKVEDL